MVMHKEQVMRWDKEIALVETKDLLLDTNQHLEPMTISLSKQGLEINSTTPEGIGHQISIMDPIIRLNHSQTILLQEEEITTMIISETWMMKTRITHND